MAMHTDGKRAAEDERTGSMPNDGSRLVHSKSFLKFHVLLACRDIDIDIYTYG